MRLALWYTLFLLVTIGVVSVLFLAALESNLQREVDDALALRASHVQQAVDAGRDGLEEGSLRPDVLQLAPLEEFSTPGIYVQVLGRDGAVLALSPNLPGGLLPIEGDVVTAALSRQEVFATVPAGTERVRLLARPLLSGEEVIGVLLVGESLHPLEVSRHRTQQLLLLAAAGAAIVALVSGWQITGRALGPIAEVTGVARRIAATGQFERRITEPPAQDELGELTATFNAMLASLEKTFERQREFIADVSHELRGPLMVIRGNLDLLKRKLSNVEREESAAEASEEVDRMSRLVADLLFLAEVDAREFVEHDPVALQEVTQEVWERAKALDGECHEILLAQSDPATVLGDRDRLAQMLWNLVENALRYTPEGGQITLSLRNHQQVAELSVADTGMGISADHVPRIFERFYRIDRARSHSRGSTGLGLAIVKQVAEAHGGQVRVRSEPGKGSVFSVALPIQRG
ncbi:MAG: ATP-binding protein [Dehalococcoidia bacterium]|nr:ATP-binding protein [Dehalococcoidia bacterium]